MERLQLCLPCLDKNLFEKIIPGKFLRSTDLAKAQDFCVYKITKMVVIYEHENFVFIVFSVMSLYFEGLEDGSKLIFLSFVLCFGCNQFM